MTTADAILNLHEMLATCAELSTCPALSAEVDALRLVINRHLLRYEDEWLLATEREWQLYRGWTEWLARLCERFEMEDLY